MIAVKFLFSRKQKNISFKHHSDIYSAMKELKL